MATTREVFDALAPGYASDSAVQVYLDLAAARLDLPTWGKLAQQAVALLAAHLLTLRDRSYAGAGGTGAVGALTSVQAGSMSASYAAPSATFKVSDAALGQTTFGLDLLALRASLPDALPSFLV